MKKLILKISIVAFLISCTSQELMSQVEFGFRADLGSVTILNTDDNSESISNVFPQFGTFLNIPFNKKIYAGAEVSINFLKGIEERGPFATDDGFISGSSGSRTETDNYKLGYVNIPVYLGMNFKKFQMDIGFQTSFKTIEANKRTEVTSQNGQITETITSDPDLKFADYDYGPRLGIGYEISNKFSVTAFYYYGLTDIREDDFVRKIRQVAIGCKYRIK